MVHERPLCGKLILKLRNVSLAFGRHIILIRKKKYYTIITITIALAFLACSFYIRPRLSVFFQKRSIEVANQGKMGALLHNVDVFWYVGGEVFFIRNLPPVAQTFEPGKDYVPLDIPEIPAPKNGIESKGSVYMKTVLGYRAKWLPVFRYKQVSYFEYVWQKGRWELVEDIPAKYRALGKTGLGIIEPLDLDFHKQNNREEDRLSLSLWDLFRLAT